MPGLSFLNPAFLSALALAGVPLLIHLIRKRRVRTVPWAAWEFLRDARRQNRRRLQVEQWLLLLLRVLIVCFVVLAFCRPVLRALGALFPGANSRVHALLVLDNSYSMGYRRGGESDFERARRVADDLLTRVLRQGDSVSLVLLSDRPAALIREPTFDLRAARDRVRAASLGDRGTDYGAGARFCADLLAGVRAPIKEVYWITDSQKAGFPPSGGERARAAWGELARRARVTWIDVSSPGRANVAVEPPAFSRALVTPLAPVRIEALVRNRTGSAKPGLLVNLAVDDRPVGSTRVDVPAGRAARASFVYLFPRPGAHTGSIALAQPDGLARDDVAHFAVKVRERLRVLVVNPRPASDPARDEAFYLTTALAPVAASEGGRLAIEPTVHAGPRLSGRSLRQFDAVIVTGMADLGVPERRALEEFARGGGGVLLFPGPTTDPRAVNALMGGSLLPARIGARQTLPEERALALNPQSIRHPVLAAFRDTSEINLGSARFRLVYGLQVRDASAQVLCRFSDGRPALVEKRFGQGRVILAAGTAGVSGGTLPFKPAFVPLVHQLVAYLAEGPTAQRSLRPGQPIAARFDVRAAGRPVRLTLPTGKTTLLRTTLGAEGVTAAFTNTERAGLYRLALPGQGTAEAFAVNVPAGEGDLAALDERQVRTALGVSGPSRLSFARGGEDIAAAVRQARRGTEIWRTLVLAALPLLFLESLLAQRWGRRG